MASMHDEGWTQDIRRVAASRRAVVAAGAGWVLGTAGLLLPAPGDEAEARGALGGAKGGRHGKDHRGRNKNRGKDRDPNDNDANEPRDEGLRGIRLTLINGSDSTLVVSGQAPLAPGERWSEDDGPTTFFVFSVRSQNYQFYAQNPIIGQPYVLISLDPSLDRAYYHEFSEGEEFTSGAFKAKRLGDTDDFKVFEVTAL